LRQALAALLALLFAGSAQAQTAVQVPAQAPAALDTSDAVRPDPAVKRGVLPNGLRYAVMRNAQPAQGVSIRMNVKVGSFDENDDELGIAHFLEHMAFNGTRSIPEDELDRVFAAQGVAFGKDQNASTSFFDTTYYLDLPLADATKLDLGFRWMREIGDGMVLSPEAVNRERGVVLAEHDRALSPARSYAEAQAAFLSPELRGPTRWPIGTRAVLQKIDSRALRSFYDRWYRPENAVVVVVGDQPAAELERRVRETFGSWQGRGAAPKRVERRSPALDRGMDILVRSEPQLPSGFSACRPRARDPDRPETLSRWRENTPRWLWQTILNERLQRLARTEKPPFVAAAASYNDAYQEAAYSCVSVSPVNEDWRTALNVVLQETRRMEAHGVTAEEIRRAVTARRTAFRAAVGQADTRGSASLAGQLLSELSEETEEVFSRPEENLRLFEASVAGIGPKEVSEGYPARLVGRRSADRPARAQGSVRCRGARRLGLGPRRRRSRTARGRGAQGLGLQQLRRARPGGETRDGGRSGLHPRHLRERRRDELQARGLHPRPGGRQRAAGRRAQRPPYENPMTAMLAAQLFTAAGLGQHDLGDLTWLFQDRRWSVGFTLDNNWYGLLGSTSPEDLELQMQIWAPS
jgi:zinc protease